LGRALVAVPVACREPSLDLRAVRRVRRQVVRRLARGRGDPGVGFERRRIRRRRLLRTEMAAAEATEAVCHRRLRVLDRRGVAC
jgi:hypothetical protein